MHAKILLIAYQCGPGMGSVSQIGWEWFIRLSQTNQVTLVTHIRNRFAIEKETALSGNDEIIYIDTEWFAGPLYRLAKRIFPRSEHSVFLVSSLDYFVFDAAAFFQIKKINKSGNIWDIMHRVTPVTTAAPTWLGRLGLPLVLGPLNSGLSDPKGFDKIMSQESSWLIRFREFGKIFDALIGSSKLAACILVASKATLESIPIRYREKCVVMIENGVELTRFKATPWPNPPTLINPLQVLFVGRLIPLKALDLLIDAVSFLSATGVLVELTVVGDGPMRSDWEGKVKELNLINQIRFVGNLSLEGVSEYMQRCHVFCLPSIRESGGAVLLEAMASARPVIAINFGGPGELVDKEVGELIEPTSPEQVTKDLANSLSKIISNPEGWSLRGKVGRLRVESHYSWEAKVSSAITLYGDILEKRSQ